MIDLELRAIGKTGLRVSSLSLGTVSLGSDYGLAAPGARGRPPESAALAVLDAAAANGIRFFDTAPAYGEAERLLGLAFADRPEVVIATKVNLPGPLSRDAAQRAVDSSLARSRTTLKRDQLDVVLIHNATLETFHSGHVPAALLAAKGKGRIRAVGASVYREDEALAAIEAGMDLVQVAVSVLDQRMLRRVIPLAAQRGVAVVARSALLKGVLTARSRWLPDHLAPLRIAADKAREGLGATWDDLPEAAMRYALGAPGITSVLTGASSVEELEAALAALKRGPLPGDIMARAASLAIDDPKLLDPSTWGIP